MDYPTIVGFSGAGAVGKTSVMNYLKEKYDNKYIIIPSITRHIMKEFNCINEDNMLDRSESFKFSFENALINKYVENLEVHIEKYKNTNKILLCDRTPLDIFTYTLFNCSNYITNNYDVDNFENSILNEFIYKPLSLFDIVYHFEYPTSFIITNDGFRTQLSTRNYFIEYIMLGLIDKINYYMDNKYKIKLIMEAPKSNLALETRSFKLHSSILEYKYINNK